MDLEYNSLQDEIERWKKAYQLLWDTNARHVEELEQAVSHNDSAAILDLNQRVLDMLQRKITDQTDEINNLRIAKIDAEEIIGHAYGYPDDPLWPVHAREWMRKYLGNDK